MSGRPASSRGALCVEIVALRHVFEYYPPVMSFVSLVVCVFAGLLLPPPPLSLYLFISFLRFCSSLRRRFQTTFGVRIASYPYHRKNAWNYTSIPIHFFHLMVVHWKNFTSFFMYLFLIFVILLLCKGVPIA